MVQQEKITDKWKSEHKRTCDYFEKSLKNLEVENRMLKDKVIQLKSTVSVLREEKNAPAGAGNAIPEKQRSSSSRTKS